MSLHEALTPAIYSYRRATKIDLRPANRASKPPHLPMHFKARVDYDNARPTTGTSISAVSNLSNLENPEVGVPVVERALLIVVSASLKKKKKKCKGCGDLRARLRKAKKRKQCVFSRRGRLQAGLGIQREGIGQGGKTYNKKKLPSCREPPRPLWALSLGSSLSHSKETRRGNSLSLPAFNRQLCTTQKKKTRYDVPLTVCTAGYTAGRRPQISGTFLAPKNLTRAGGLSATASTTVRKKTENTYRPTAPTTEHHARKKKINSCSSTTTTNSQYWQQ